MLDFSRDAHGYQKSGAGHLWNSASTFGVAVLWLDPGYGKTAITLHAFKALKDAGIVRTMLVVAPLRVAQTVWTKEITEWSSLAGLRACVLHGAKKEKWLKRRDVDIWIINYEGLQWLGKLAKDGKLTTQFDVICFDELRRMKESQGKRFKAIRPIAATAKFRWGLTGTPASNGLQDLFGQFLILDQGRALGDRKTRFMHDFFEKGWDGFTWQPRPGTKEALEKRLEPYVFRASGHLNLPPTIPDDRVIQLDPKGRKAYDAMKRDLITQIEGEAVTAANAAVLYGKLKQMANGRIYDEHRNIIHIHDAKKQALEELVEELGDEQLLIAVDFHHDIDQIREVLGDRVRHFKECTTTAKTVALEEAWNKREVQFIADHPDSIAHGLNLQKGGAHHILWWSPTVNLDHWIQFNQRLDRQGNPASTIVIHQFVTEKSVNETDIQSRGEKNDLQSSLLNALTAEFGDSITLDTKNQEIPMNQPLQFKADADQGQAPAQGQNPFAAQQGQQAPTQQPAQGQNPFAPQQGQAPQTQQPAPQQPAQNNPFAAQGGAPQQDPQQVQNIQQDVSAPPPQHPVSEAPPNPFAAQQGQQAPAPQQQVEDAQVVSETPPQPQSQPEQAPQPTANDTGWQDPKPAVAATSEGMQNTSAPAPAVSSETPAPAGMVPLYVFVPADKLDKVFSAIGRAVK